MSSTQLAETVMALPETERLELARRIVESLAENPGSAQRIAEGVRRIEEVAAGAVSGLDEAQFRAALK
ncbi:MAG: addiction module protein [Verrucomicrobia bacterium]|nr:addiction module protein [Verrucomicrobiota bacterium]